MFNYKGGGIIFLRKIIQKAGKETELLSQLNTEEQQHYNRTLEVSWVPIAFANKLFELTSQLCYADLPHDKQLYQVGLDLAKSSVNNIYRLVFKLISPHTILKKAANVWRTYHSGGTGAVINKTEHSASFQVTGYPDLPENFAEATCGYIAGLLELAGAVNSKVTKSNENDNWLWHAKWDS